MPNQTVTIKTDEKNPEPVEVIARSIEAVSKAFATINSGRLTQRVIILLIKDQCPGMTINEIKKILDVVPKLGSIYLKKA